jgi:dynein light chain LC8-type
MSKAVVKFSDMDTEMLDFAIAQAAFAQENLSSEKEVALHLKEQFEERYSPTWHCLVGRNFGSYVTHENGKYCYFYINQMGVSLWKTTN